MLTFELPTDEHRRRLRHALLKDLADMKNLRKKNLEEEADVGDIDWKIALINGDRSGTPGLIQIFSTQGELFGDRARTGDPAQMSIEDAVAEASYRESDDKWAEWVPEPRPKAGERVRALDGEGLFVIVSPLGYVRLDGLEPQSLDAAAAPEAAVFVAFAVPIAKAEGFTADDKVKVYLQGDSVRDEVAEWTQVPTPPNAVDTGAMRAAVEAGADDEAGTTTDLEEFGKHGEQGNGAEPGVKPRKARKRASAGNLAPAVRKEVARATGERKHPAKRSGSGKK